MVKLQTLFIFTLIIILFENIKGSNSDLTVYSEMNSSRSLPYFSELENRLSAEYAIMPQESLNAYNRRSSNVIQMPHEDELQNLNEQQVSQLSASFSYTNNARISQTTRLVEVPVVVNYKEKFSTASNVAFALLSGIYLLKLGISIAYVANYFSNPDAHDSHDSAVTPILDLTTDAGAFLLLSTLYVCNKDRI